MKKLLQILYSLDQFKVWPTIRNVLSAPNTVEKTSFAMFFSHN